MIRRRHIAPFAAFAAAALMLAGCGGGGGDVASSDTSTLPDASLPVASGVSAAESANQAVAALGTPGAVDQEVMGKTLSGYDRFGTPHDAFDQQVDGSGSSSTEPGSAAQIPADEPVIADPIVATPIPGNVSGGGTEPGGSTTPDPNVPVQNPRALEADFDVSGEPVVAREGDAIPPDTQQFIVQVIGTTSVTLELSGGLLPDGTDTVELDEGESITLYNATARRSYKIKLVDVRPA